MTILLEGMSLVFENRVLKQPLRRPMPSRPDAATLQQVLQRISARPRWR